MLILPQFYDFDNMIVESLRQFGLNEKEISVYLALVSLGEAPVREISRQARVNRGTTYDILKKLLELGLVSQIHKEGKKQHFVPESPQKLIQAIKRKQEDLKLLQEEVKKNLPELETIYEKSGAKPIVRYFEGKKGVRLILEDVLFSVLEQKEKIYYVYSSADIRDYLYQAYPDFNKDRIGRKIKVQAIAFGEGGELAGLDERKWLSKQNGSPSYVLIYKDNLAMITLNLARQPVGAIIKNQALYETQKMVFQKLWQVL